MGFTARRRKSNPVVDGCLFLVLWLILILVSIATTAATVYAVIWAARKALGL